MYNLLDPPLRLIDCCESGARVKLRRQGVVKNPYVDYSDDMDENFEIPSDSLSSKDTLHNLRECLINLQKYITKQQGMLIDMKKEISLRATKAEVDIALSMKLAPNELHRRIQDARDSIQEKIDAKLDRSDLTPLINRKVNKHEFQELQQEVRDLVKLLEDTKSDVISVEVPAAESQSNCAGDKSLQLSDLEEIQDRMEQLEISVELFVKNSNKSTVDAQEKAKHEAQLFHETLTTSLNKKLINLTNVVNSTKDLYTDLQTRYSSMSLEVAKIDLKEHVKSIKAAQSRIETIDTELQMYKENKCESENAYKELEQYIRNIHDFMQQASSHMEDQQRLNANAQNEQKVEMERVGEIISELRHDINSLKNRVRDQSQEMNTQIQEFTQEGQVAKEHIADWKSRISQRVHSVEQISNESYNAVKDIRDPIIQEMENLKSENKMFFREVLRTQTRYDALVERLNVLSNQTNSPQTNIPFSHTRGIKGSPRNHRLRTTDYDLRKIEHLFTPQVETIKQRFSPGFAKEDIKHRKSLAFNFSEIDNSVAHSRDAKQK